MLTSVSFLYVEDKYVWTCMKMASQRRVEALQQYKCEPTPSQRYGMGFVSSLEETIKAKVWP